MLLFGIIFFLVGLIFFVFMSIKLCGAIKSKSWPYVWGKIDTAETRRVTVRDAGDSISGHSATLVNYAYIYEINGMEYTSKRVTFSDNMVKTGGSLNKILNELVKDQQVKVYYNPKEPSDSVLKPGPSIYNFTPFITSFLFMGVGIWLAFFANFS